MGGGGWVEERQTLWTPSIVLAGFKGWEEEVGGAGMGPGIGWELETPTIPQSPPLLFLLMSMTCSDKRRKRGETIM